MILPPKAGRVRAMPMPAMNKLLLGSVVSIVVRESSPVQINEPEEEM